MHTGAPAVITAHAHVLVVQVDVVDLVWDQLVVMSGKGQVGQAVPAGQQ